MTQSLPVIDLAGLTEADPAAIDRIVAAVGAACRGPGFFYIVNHGVAADLIADAFAEAKRFFALPAAAKQALAIERIGNNRGYAGFGNEALDPSKPADLKQSFNIGLELAPDDPAIDQPFRGLNGWPERPEFRRTLLDYYAACHALGTRLHQAFARDLGLAPDFFADKIDRPMAVLRLLHYPPQAADAAPGQIGAGEHTDYGNITLLMNDEVGGLEVRPRGGADWIRAPVLPGAFVVNIGDCLMRWTNDVYVSTPHRVINQGGRERYSIAFFLDPNPDAEVAAIPGCVAEGAAPHYPPTTGAAYLAERLNATYAFRRSPAG